MGHRAPKLTAAVVALGLAMTALAGCTAVEPAPSALPAKPAELKPAESNPATPEPTGQPSAEADPDACASSAEITFGRMSASLVGELVDRGPRPLAMGTTVLGGDAKIESYVVAPGDAVNAIGQRFCIRNPLSIEMLNHTRTIQPDEELLLRHDSDIPWVPFFAPEDAPAGFAQIPYQRAVWAMGAAADAGDITGMRAIFADRLSAMFPNPDDAAVIADALDEGDINVLRQMFP